VKDVQLLTYSSCTLLSLAGVYGCRDNEGDVEIQFNLEAKRAGSPHVVKSSEDCCCFWQSSVDICFNISIARYYTFQVRESLYIFYVPLCNGYWLWWWALGDFRGLRFFSAYIQSYLAHVKSINCHFRDCKTLLVTSPSHIRSVIEIRDLILPLFLFTKPELHAPIFSSKALSEVAKVSERL